MSEEIIVELTSPVHAFGREITELKLTRPKVRELRRAMRGAEGEFDVSAALIAELSGLSLEAVDEMALGDFMRATAALSGLLPPELRGNVETEAGAPGKA